MVSRAGKRGSWDPLLVGIIIIAFLFLVVIVFWARQGGSFMDFLQGLFGIAQQPP